MGLGKKTNGLSDLFLLKSKFLCLELFSKSGGSLGKKVCKSFGLSFSGKHNERHLSCGVRLSERI